MPCFGVGGLIADIAAALSDAVTAFRKRRQERHEHKEKDANEKREQPVGTSQPAKKHEYDEGFRSSWESIEEVDEGEAWENVPISQTATAVDRQVVCAIAKYSYTARSYKELSFPKGAGIILRRRNPRGWLLGTCGGKYGWVPENYIQLELEPSDEELDLVDEELEGWDEDDRELVMSSDDYGRCATAVYDYDGTVKGTISFAKGAKITNVGRVASNGWVWGKYFGEGGWLPLNHLESEDFDEDQDPALYSGETERATEDERRGSRG